MPLAGGTGLAHLGACLSVGRELRRRGHDVTLAYGGDLGALAARSELPVVPVRERPVSARRPPPPARWYRDADDLAASVAGDRGVIERLDADAIVSDMRMSATIAAEAAGVPQVELQHFLPLLGHGPSPKRPARWRRPRSAAEAVAYRLGLRPAMDARLLALVTEVRGRLGLPFTGSLWSHRGVVACTTTPWLDPGHALPPRWEYVGPIVWSAPVAAGGTAVPARGARPLVYVTQGSSGSAALLRRAVRDLAAAPVDVLATCAELCDPEELVALGPNVRAERYLPGAACCAAADVAVVHGGHLTACEAHIAGTPVVVVPYEMDHWTWAARVERLGSGVAVHAPRRPGLIARAASRVLGDESYARAARAVGEHFREWDGTARTADLVERVARR